MVASLALVSFLASGVRELHTLIAGNRWHTFELLRRLIVVLVELVVPLLV